MTKFEIELSDADLVYILNDRGAFSSFGSPEGQKIGQQIRDQLPPPRMAEPGWGERVVASVGGRPREVWLHAYSTGHAPWKNVNGVLTHWHQLDDPQPVDGAS